MNVLALLRAEWIKTIRLRMTYIAFAAVAVLVVLIQGAIYVNAPDSWFVEVFRAWDLPTGWIVNGYQSTLMTALAAFSLLIAPMTIVTFARQIAGEDSRGTLRMILARPIGRFALINAKFTVGAAATALLMGFFFTLSYGMGLMLFKPQLSITVPQMRALDFDEIDPEYREFERTAREEARSRGRRGRFGPREVDWRSSIQGRIIQMRISAELERTLITPMEGVKRLAFVWLLSTWALLTLGSIAFFYSSLTKHSIAAMAMTLGTYFLVMILQGLASADNVIPLFETIEPYLFTTEMDVFTHALAAEIGPEEKREIRRGVRLLGAYTLIFYAATQFIFWRKDITS